MNNILAQSAFFGIALSLICYIIGVKLQQVTGLSAFNPLAVASIIIIALLLFFRIDYETYENGAKYITYFLTPATVCLAVPLYRQIEILKKNFVAVISGILAGCIGHVVLIVLLGAAFAVKKDVILSLLPKSVTTPIAMGVCEEIGGVIGITVIGVIVAGNIGAMFAPVLLKLIRVEEPVAKGLAIGCCSHALGTSKALELGEIEGAMSSLAIVVTGLMTVVIVPIFVNLFLV